MDLYIQGEDGCLERSFPAHLVLCVRSPQVFRAKHGPSGVSWSVVLREWQGQQVTEVSCSHVWKVMLAVIWAFPQTWWLGSKWVSPEMKARQKCIEFCSLALAVTPSSSGRVSC